ncbi:aldo/keto reductase [Streptomyces sp. NBC_00038]|uniref:aldo/keto reductase n=1 Tax=Streptomyces sp. NBC_00038 TaxID=2903615 RepID=UPI00224DD422|nr:aldo/keto reductase [Streptomyces sp. NBC_00038]MCX5555254.1 aldo/keto reductase [Streptomyces sp. NBC_00038]
MPPVPIRTLNDGGVIPALGLGTAPLDDARTEEAVAHGLRIGYRLIDTGAVYGNEGGVGRAVAAAEVPREEIRVLTKLPGRHHGYDTTLASFEESRGRLGLEYVDLYLIHWPLPRLDKYVDSWKALIRLREEGLVRSIGVSNFTAEHLDRLEKETGVLPAVNQIEMHPQHPQEELRAVHAEKGIITLSYSPLGRGTGLVQDPAVAAVAAAHRVTPAQVILRWHLQLGAVPLPRSGDTSRRRDNLDVFGFELSAAELARVGDRARIRIGYDPESHEEF